MRTVWVGISVMLWLIGSSSTAQTVDWEALPAMVSRTPAALAAQWQVKAVEARRGHLGRSLQPKVNIGLAGVAGAATSNGSFAPEADSSSTWAETSANVGLNLWRGNQDRHQDEAIDAEAKASMQEVSRDLQQRLSEARGAWLDAWTQSRRLEILAKVGEQIKEDRQRAEKKANAGLTSQTDVMEFELRLQELGLEVAQVQERKDAALSQLASLLSLGSVRLDLGAGIEQVPEPKAVDQAGMGLDELVLNSQSQARLADADAQGQWPFPSVDAGLRGLIGGPDTSLAGSQGYEARLGLTLSLWETGQASVERNYFGYQSQALVTLAEGAKRERQEKQEFLRRRMERWTGMSKALQDRLAMAQEFREKVSKEYARGVKDARDLESATQAVANASMAIVEARSSAWDAWSQLDRLKPAEGAQP